MNYRSVITYCIYFRLKFNGNKIGSVLKQCNDWVKSRKVRDFFIVTAFNEQINDDPSSIYYQKIWQVLEINGNDWWILMMMMMMTDDDDLSGANRPSSLKPKHRVSDDSPVIPVDF